MENEVSGVIIALTILLIASVSGWLITCKTKGYDE